MRSNVCLSVRSAAGAGCVAKIAAATERVLAAKARQKPKQPKPQPKVKPPVKKDPLEVSIESMSADAFKKALQDPAKARGIENVLSRRNN